MSKKEMNFDLGSRRLTEAEAAAVEHAKARLLESLGRHRKDIDAHLVFASPPKTKVAAKPAAKKAAAKPAVKAAPRGSDAWTSTKIAPAIRKY